MKSDIDHSQLDEFLGFSYAVSPDLSLNNGKTSATSLFAGFSYVALNEHSLKAYHNDEVSDHTRYTSDEEARSRICSGEVNIKLLCDEDSPRHEDECLHPMVGDLSCLELKD